VWVLIENFRNFPRHDGVHLTAAGSEMFAATIVTTVMTKLDTPDE
jgi:hypothetical protein